MSQAGNKNVLPWDNVDVKFGLFETVQFLDKLLCPVECSIFKTKKQNKSNCKSWWCDLLMLVLCCAFGKTLSTQIK